MSSSSDQMSLSPDAMSGSPSPPRSSDGRQLPSIPTAASSSPRGPNNVNSNSNNNNRGNNGYGPFFQEYSLLAEYNQLHQQKIPGLYVMPCATTPLIWSGLLFIRQGLYQGGAYRFTLTIPDNYPDGNCPKFVFEYKIFHPLINPTTGEVDIERAFPRWRRNVNHLWQVFLHVKKLFYKIDVKLPLNNEAATLYEQDREGFKSRVCDDIAAAHERLHLPPVLDDPFALRFSPWNEAVHSNVQRQMMNSSKRFSSDASSANPADLGLSWMDTTQAKIFCRDDPDTGTE